MCCDGVKKICDSLRNNSSVTVLNLRGIIFNRRVRMFDHNFLLRIANAIRTEGGRALGELLKMNKRIKSLNLECVASYLSMDKVYKKHTVPCVQTIF